MIKQINSKWLQAGLQIRVEIIPDTGPTLKKKNRVFLDPDLTQNFCKHKIFSQRLKKDIFLHGKILLKFWL